MSASEEDRRFMRLALGLGARGSGRCWPNPAVGAVLVRDGRILGRGWTQPGGRPHAETEALARVGAAARGATAYVSMEPCAHHGRTPPCAEALVAAGVARVVTPMEDPDPRVAGRGHAALAAGGATVETGVLAEEAARAHRGFLLNRTIGRPSVTLKLAASLDGRIATAAGESRWITGAEARRATHAMRARHDAVLVGAGTARTDDPALTVRGLGIEHQPVRVVAVSDLDLPRDGWLARTAGEAALWLLHGEDVAGDVARLWDAAGARRVPVARAERGGLAPEAMLAALGRAGLTSVLCEGGGRLAAALLAAGLVDELAVFSAGTALGGDGTAAVGPMGLGRLAEAPRFALIETRPVGGDVLSRWERVEAASARGRAGEVRGPASESG